METPTWIARVGVIPCAICCPWQPKKQNSGTVTSPDYDKELYFDVLSREYKVALIGSLRHTATLGTDLYGNIQRLDMDRPENEIVDCDLTDNHSTLSPVHSLDR